MLGPFLETRREEILTKARTRIALRPAPLATEWELLHGLPILLERLVAAFERAAAHPVSADAIPVSSGSHVHGLFAQGLTVTQVVHDYADLCHVITALAVDLGSGIRATEFRTLDLCLDHAIAGAVTEHARQRAPGIADEGTPPLGAVASEMRILVDIAMNSFLIVKKGLVAPGGSTGTLHEQTLLELHSLVGSLPSPGT